MGLHESPRWGPWRSLLALAPLFVFAPLMALNQHYKLPTPLSNLTDTRTNLPQISEERVLSIAQTLSEDIGYRTVGTYEHSQADDWMWATVQMTKANCERIVRNQGRKLECEVWHQRGSGTHRFDMMGKRLYKTYHNLTNIIVRISDGTNSGKKHALLVNAHLDSTLPSPGAADDALAVGVMVECMRVLVETPRWSPKHAIIFLFNNAEESLQDGSHLYATQHPTASTVRAVVNLEAAGTTGRELLFQATSEQMIHAYSKVPRPYGTTFANEIFSSGILLSDTDFRQFEEYLGVTGLDMAVVGNSYLYHMRKDVVANIEPGVAQHMGENTLALMRYLSSEESPLPSLAEGYSPPSTIFFAHMFHTFFQYSYSTAKKLYAALLVASFALVRFYFVDPTPAVKSGDPFWREQKRGFIAVMSGVVGTIVVPNVLAIIMRSVVGKPMSWFTSPALPLGLYGPAALLGALVSQYLVGQVNERTIYTSMLLLQAFFAFALQLVGIGSAALFFLTGLPLFVSLLVDPLFSRGRKELSLVTYFLGQSLPLTTGTMLLMGTLDFFVPLTGRIGAEAPADNMVATIISVLGALTVPLVLPFSHRFGQRALFRGMTFTAFVTAILVAVYSSKPVFDDMHQKRLFVLHLENITSNEHHLHLAAADGAPGFDSLVQEIVQEFGVSEQLALPVVMDDYNSDWDPLYPFSAFLTPYKVAVPVETGYVSPWSSHKRFAVDAVDHPSRLGPETRNMTITVRHPGLIWTAIAFDAHVLSWSLDNNPPDEYARHHLKEASFYGSVEYSFDAVIKKPPTDDGKVAVTFVALQETGMWPAKAKVKAYGGPAMRLFEELDEWLNERTEGKVDALLMGAVGGVSSI